MTCHTRGRGSQVCLELHKLVLDLVTLQEKVADKLINLLLSKDKYVSYLSGKTIVSFSKVMCLFDQSNHFVNCMGTRLLLQLSDDSLCHVEVVLSLLENSLARTMSVIEELSLARNENCPNLLAVNPSLPVGNVMQLFSPVIYGIPDLLRKLTSEVLNESSRSAHILRRSIGVLHLALPMLPPLTDLVYRDHDVFLERLCISTSVCELQSLCLFLKKVFGHDSLVNDPSDTSQLHQEIALKCMDSTKTLLSTWREMSRLEARMLGFGGTFYLSEKTRVYEGFEYVQCSLPSQRALILLHLSSLVTLSRIPQPTNDMLVVYRSGVLALGKSQKELCHFQSDVKLPGCVSSYLVHLFVEQDDALVEMLLYLLEISLFVQRCCAGIFEEMFEECNPHYDFYYFLQSIGDDYETMLDFLISNETCFLLYLVKYLKCVIHGKAKYLQAHAVLSSTAHSDSARDLPTSRSLGRSELLVGRDEKYRSSTVEVGNAVSLVEYSSHDSDSSDDSCKPPVAGSSSVNVHKDLGGSHNVPDEPDTLPGYASSVVRQVKVLKDLTDIIRLYTEKHRFPYNAKPLLKLLTVFADAFSLN